MKLIYPLLILSFLTNIVESQIPFAPLGAKYFTKEECPPFGGPPPFLWEITVDSVIQGKYCTRISSVFTTTCSHGNYYVHSDGYKVYVYDEGSDEFFLIYDFSKNEGESYRIKLCEEEFKVDSATVEVIGVTNMMYGSIPAVVQTLKVTTDKDSTNWWTFFEVEIYEGIGGIHGNRLLVPQGFFLTTDCYSLDLCYYSPLTGAVSLGGDSQPCVPAGTDEKEVLNYFHLAPNPSHGDFYLEYDFPVRFHNLSALVYDGTGRLCQTFELENQHGKLQINNLGKGIYFIAIAVDGEIAGSKKAIVLE